MKERLGTLIVLSVLVECPFCLEKQINESGDIKLSWHPNDLQEPQDRTCKKCRRKFIVPAFPLSAFRTSWNPDGDEE